MRVQQIFLAFFATLTIYSCTNNSTDENGDATTDSATLGHPHPDSVSDAGFFSVGKDSVTVLPFEIDIELSPMAKEKIVNSKETIVVNVTLTGDPKDEKLLAEDGSYYVASAEKEINYGEVAKFDRIRFPKSTYEQLVNKDVTVNVFFYSGRKSSADNLLEGDLLNENISKVANKKFQLRGKLIYGED